MDGEATPAQLAGLLLALRMRGETADELAGFALAMRERVLAVEAPAGPSTPAARAATARRPSTSRPRRRSSSPRAGVPVAKHGNRAMSSASGSADVLEALGIPIDLHAGRCVGGPRARRLCIPVRTRLPPGDAARGTDSTRAGRARPRSTCLGPLTNPAGVRRQMIGVADPTVAPRSLTCCTDWATERAFVVHGDGRR